MSRIVALSKQQKWMDALDESIPAIVRTARQDPKKLVLYGTNVTGRAVASRLLGKGVEFYGFCGRRAQEFPDGLMGMQVCYASRGLAAVAASNINGTVFNLFALLMMSMGDAVGIMVGQQLGANDMERAKSTVRKLLVFGVGLNAVVGLGLIFCAPFIPLIYT